MPVLYTILGIIVFLLVLGIIVLLHEAGHFIIAKKSEILCHEFSIGMGPLIWQTKKGETMFSIRAIPFGGYVAMAGEEVESDILKDVKQVKVLVEDDKVVKIIVNLNNPKYQDLPIYDVVSYDLSGTLDALEDELFIELADSEGNTSRYTVLREAMVNFNKKEEMQIAPKNRTFVNKPFWNRFLSVLAGPLMNFVLAVVVFFCMGLIYGYPDTSTTEIAVADGAVVEAGLESGDKIYSINGVVVNDWDDITNELNKVARGEGITADGCIEIKYYDSSNNNQLTDAKVYPEVVIMSSDMIIDYDKESNMVFVSAIGGIEGFEKGDKIIKLDDQKILGINDCLKFFTSLDGEHTIKAQVIDKDGKEATREITPYSKGMLDASNLEQTKTIMGIQTSNKFNFVKLMYMPWVETGNASLQIFKTLGLFFQKDSGIKLTHLSGPVGILNLFTQLVQGENAFYNILYWTGLLSVNIGLINLLPLPALDGGRLAFLAYEGITKKKPTPKVENTIHNIGFILLMALFVVILFSDIIKCF